MLFLGKLCSFEFAKGFGISLTTHDVVRGWLFSRGAGPLFLSTCPGGYVPAPGGSTQERQMFFGLGGKERWFRWRVPKDHSEVQLVNYSIFIFSKMAQLWVNLMTLRSSFVFFDRDLPQNYPSPLFPMFQTPPTNQAKHRSQVAAPNVSGMVRSLGSMSSVSWRRDGGTSKKQLLVRYKPLQPLVKGRFFFWSVVVGRCSRESKPPKASPKSN